MKKIILTFLAPRNECIELYDKIYDLLEKHNAKFETWDCKSITKCESVLSDEFKICLFWFVAGHVTAWVVCSIF